MTLTIPGIVRLEQDAHGLSHFVVTNVFAEAHVYLLGIRHDISQIGEPATGSRTPGDQGSVAEAISESPTLER